MIECSTCKTKECQYIEVKTFISYINEKFNKYYFLSKCPDKCNDIFTCDLVFSDKTCQENLYVEVKEVKHGFSEKIEIAKNENQLSYGYLISEILQSINEEKQKLLKDFSITVPKKQLYKDEKTEFCLKMKRFLEEIEFEKTEEYIFAFNRKQETIDITIKSKTEEMFQFGENTLFEYETEKNNSLDEIFLKVCDFDNLKKLIVKNCNNTTDKKFIGVEGRKILLNILKLPLGYDLFLDINIKNCIASLMSDSKKKFMSEADECYLLFYTDNYFETHSLSGQIETTPHGEVLFIVPLIGGMITEPIEYTITTNEHLN